MERCYFFKGGIATFLFRYLVGFMVLGVGWGTLWMWLSNGAVVHLSLC